MPVLYLSLRLRHPAVAAGLDAEALDKRGEETSKKFTQELRQKANITYR